MRTTALGWLATAIAGSAFILSRSALASRAAPAGATGPANLAGFACARVFADLEQRGITAPFIPPQPNMLPKDGFPRTESQRLALAARGRTKSAEGIWAHARRMADSESAISEVKFEGTLARARCRGTPLFHVQVLVDCAAINCKRLVRHARAATGVAAAPVAGLAATAAERRRRRHGRLWSFSVCLN